jgi:hypothetical protein
MSLSKNLIKVALLQNNIITLLLKMQILYVYEIKTGKQYVHFKIIGKSV